MVSRYAFDGDEEYNPQGDWVSVSDYDALAAENQALRERAKAAERRATLLAEQDSNDCDALQTVQDMMREVASFQTALTEARAREAAAWDAVEPIRSLIELTECGEISGLHWADEFGLFLLGDDDEPVYCAIKLTFEQLGKIAPTSPTSATAALTARLDAEWNEAIEAAAGKMDAASSAAIVPGASGRQLHMQYEFQRLCEGFAAAIRALRRAAPTEGEA